MADLAFAPVQERVPKYIPEAQELTQPAQEFRAPPEVSSDATVYIMGSIPAVTITRADGQKERVVNPHQQIDVCGVSFPRFVERPANPDDKNDHTKVRDYHRQTLKRKQYDAIVARLKERAFRFGSNWGGARIVNYTKPLVLGGSAPTYDPQTDILLCDFVWIREDSLFAAAWRKDPDLAAENAALSRGITEAHKDTERLRSAVENQSDEISALKARLAGFEAEQAARDAAMAEDARASERRARKKETAPAQG